MKCWLLCVLALSVGCRSSRGNDRLPFVQPSSSSPATRSVTVTTRGNFSPPCLSIDLGETVEWNNPTGKAINVTSGSVRGMSPELYSPSLVASAAMWRHTFSKPGRVDYFDQNGAGGGAIDPYYGTRTGAASSGGAEGTVCVRNSDGSGCTALCCMKAAGAAQCAGKVCEVPSDPEIAFGFCGTSTASEPVDAAAVD